VPSFTFTVRLVNGSDEYAKLVAQTTGTAVLSVNYDANNSAQWTWQQISYRWRKTPRRMASWRLR